MDVSVTIQLTFLQCFENVEMPQIPSSTECSRLQLYYRGRVRTTQTVLKPEIPQRSSHAPVVMLRLVLGVGQCRIAVEVLQLQSVQFLEVIDTPVVLVTTGQDFAVLDKAVGMPLLCRYCGCSAVTIHRQV